jgi:hypothetical protein
MKRVIFAWEEWNIDHLSRHAVTPAEAEHVIENAEPPWPQQKGDDKLVAWGPTEAGRLLQVIFVLKAPEEVAFDALSIDEWADLDESDRVVYVIHAMDLTPAMKRRYRTRRRSS